MRHATSTPGRIPRKASFLLLASALILAAAISLKAQTTFAQLQSGAFGTLNLATGAFTQTGSTGIEPAGMPGLGNNLFTIAYGNSTLYQVNILNGALTQVGTNSVLFYDFGSTTSALYGIGFDQNLYSVNASTGATTLIGFTGLPDTGYQPLSSDGNSLYATAPLGTDSALYSVNTSTGATTLIGHTGIFQISAISFVQGQLYAVSNTSAAVYTLNLNTGAATFVANTTNSIWGIGRPTVAYTVIHNFTGGEGSTPYAGLTIDGGGNLYGTTSGGGNGFGVVFKMRQRNGQWTLAPLYKFAGGNDGASPLSRIVFGPNGKLYGTTNAGGGSSTCTAPAGCGTVFTLQPTPTAPPTPLTPWLETVIYRFQGGADGAYPGYGEMVFDPSGNIYNTTSRGGLHHCSGEVGCGVVYKMTPSGGGNYTESAIYSFNGPCCADTEFPLGAVSFDSSGRLYTTASSVGFDQLGAVIQLTPSGGNWTESTIFQFSVPTGTYPWAGVVIDGSGNLYGTASAGGPGGNEGVVYELMPSGGGWTYSILHDFPHGSGGSNPGPRAALLRDSAGNFYGTSYGPEFNQGNVFKLTPSGGGFIYTDLYDFTGGSDGGNPTSSLVLDAAGNLYGTASTGGSSGKGVVFVITPQ